MQTLRRCASMRPSICYCFNVPAQSVVSSFSTEFVRSSRVVGGQGEWCQAAAFTQFTEVDQMACRPKAYNIANSLQPNYITYCLQKAPTFVFGKEGESQGRCAASSVISTNTGSRVTMYVMSTWYLDLPPEWRRIRGVQRSHPVSHHDEARIILVDG